MRNAVWVASLIGLAAAGGAMAAASSTGPHGEAPPPRDSAAAAQISALREQVRRATDLTERLRLTRRLLEALDRDGQGQSPEAGLIVEQLLGEQPEDPVLLWRRSEARRRASDPEGALEDLGRLLAAHPDHALAVRARRALPALHLRAGRREQSAAADEALLHDGLADPAAVLTRLTRTYALLGDPRRVQVTVRRLERIAPERVRYDPDVLWLAADAADRIGSRSEAAAALLRFANLFPDDPRRSEALLRAGRAQQGRGAAGAALQLLDAAVAGARSPSLAIEGRLERGALLEQGGRKREARDEYDRVLKQTGDPATAARALDRVVSLTEQLEDAEAALLLLAAKVQNHERFVAAGARPHVARLTGALADKVVADPVRAAFVHAVAERASAGDATPPTLQLAAAALREQVGAHERAAARYQALAGRADAGGAAARAGLVRCRPREATPEDALPERLAGLEREQAWTLILKAAAPALPNATANDAVRLVAARAAFHVGDSTWAGELLANAKSPRGAAALLRGDARTLAGDWTAACRDYRAAGGGQLLAAEAAWLEVRLAECEAAEDQRDAARGRLQALLNRKPPEPIASAAELLLARIPPPAVARKRR